jgi:hypothetical protein
MARGKFGFWLIFNKCNFIFLYILLKDKGHFMCLAFDLTLNLISKGETN